MEFNDSPSIFPSDISSKQRCAAQNDCKASETSATMEPLRMTELLNYIKSIPAPETTFEETSVRRSLWITNYKMKQISANLKRLSSNVNNNRNQFGNISSNKENKVNNAKKSRTTISYSSWKPMKIDQILKLPKPVSNTKSFNTKLTRITENSSKQTNDREDKFITLVEGVTNRLLTRIESLETKITEILNNGVCSCTNNSVLENAQSKTQMSLVSLENLTETNSKQDSIHSTEIKPMKTEQNVKFPKPVSNTKSLNPKLTRISKNATKPTTTCEQTNEREDKLITLVGGVTNKLLIRIEGLEAKVIEMKNLASLENPTEINSKQDLHATEIKANMEILNVLQKNRKTENCTMTKATHDYLLQMKSKPKLKLQSEADLEETSGYVGKKSEDTNNKYLNNLIKEHSECKAITLDDSFTF